MSTPFDSQLIKPLFHSNTFNPYFYHGEYFVLFDFSNMTFHMFSNFHCGETHPTLIENMPIGNLLLETPIKSNSNCYDRTNYTNLLCYMLIVITRYKYSNLPDRGYASWESPASTAMQHRYATRAIRSSHSSVCAQFSHQGRAIHRPEIEDLIIL